MFIILWEYRVRQEELNEFMRTYAADGAWAQLFRRADGYLGTQLLRDETQPARFLTIDRWDSKGSFEAFQVHWHAEYEALDAQCEGMTETETLLGRWASV